MAHAINMTFDLLQHAGEKNPYTYFNHNINSCAISLQGKKMSFSSFVIENHNKIYGSVNCTESHERFIFIHHASSQRTLGTFPEYDSLMPSKGSTVHSATSWANPHLNYCYQASEYNFSQFGYVFAVSGFGLSLDLDLDLDLSLDLACRQIYTQTICMQAHMYTLIFIISLFVLPRFWNDMSSTGLGVVVQTLNSVY